MFHVFWVLDKAWILLGKKIKKKARKNEELKVWGSPSPLSELPIGRKRVEVGASWWSSTNHYYIAPLFKTRKCWDQAQDGDIAPRHSVATKFFENYQFMLIVLGLLEWIIILLSKFRDLY